MSDLEALTRPAVKLPEHVEVAGIIIQSGVDEWTPWQLKCVVVAALYHNYELLFEEDERGGVRLTVTGRIDLASDFLKLTNNYINNPRLFPLSIR